MLLYSGIFSGSGFFFSFVSSLSGDPFSFSFSLLSSSSSSSSKSESSSYDEPLSLFVDSVSSLIVSSFFILKNILPKRAMALKWDTCFCLMSLAIGAKNVLAKWLVFGTSIAGSTFSFGSSSSLAFCITSLISRPSFWASFNLMSASTRTTTFSAALQFFETEDFEATD